MAIYVDDDGARLRKAVYRAITGAFSLAVVSRPELVTLEKRGHWGSNPSLSANTKSRRKAVILLAERRNVPTHISRGI